jgi:hypothetical protein
MSSRAAPAKTLIPLALVLVALLLAAVGAEFWGTVSPLGFWGV